MAKIYPRSATSDQILILGVREGAVQPFSAPGWTDLRIGAFYSLVRPPTVPPVIPPTPDPNDDDPNLNTPPGTMPETVTGTSIAKYYFIGVSSPNQVQFIGFTNYGGTQGDSTLISSDLSMGTPGHYWRPYNTANGWNSFIMGDRTILASAYPAVLPHFYQSADPGNPAPAGYYCGMLGMRLTRPNATSNVITALVPNPSVNSADMLWTNAPTAANLLTAMTNWPTTVRTVGPVTFSIVPTCLYAFWPFFHSRLRISAWAISKVN